MNLFKSTTWLLPAMLSLVLSACGGGSEEESQNDRRISGRVTDQVSGIPLEGVRVNSIPATRTVATDSDGRYELIEQLATGQQYTIVASARGYRESTTNIGLVEASRADFTLNKAALFTDKKLLQVDSTTTTESVRLNSSEATDFSVTTSANWLTVAPESGSLALNERLFLTVSVNPALMPAMLGDAQILINSSIGLAPAAVNVVSFPTVAANLDSDNDGILNNTDNCPFVSNPTQSDIDANGAGDVCDAQLAVDTDNDGVRDSLDNCPQDSNASQLDSDSDGLGDGCDNTNGGSTTPIVGNDPDIAINSFNTSLNNPMVAQALQFNWEVNQGGNLVCEIDVDGNGAIEYTINNCTSADTQGHRYAAPGQYEAVLSVKDSSGGVSQLSTTVNVLPIQIDIAVSDTVAPGGRAHYEFTVSNLSATPVNNIRLLMRVPVGMSFDYRDDTSPNATGCFTCSEGSEATWRFSSLQAGESQSVMLNAQVLNSVSPGSVIPNTVDVTASVLTTALSASSSIRVNSNPLSTLSISASNDVLVAGESAEFTFNVGNISTENLSNLSIRARLPAGATASRISNNGSVDVATGDIVWSLSELAVLTTAQVKAVVTIPAAMAGQILKVAAVLNHDGGLTNDDATAENTVTVAATPSPLSVDISMDTDVAPINNYLHYDITVGNTSLVPIENIGIVFRVPRGLSFDYRDDASPDASGCFTCNPGSEAVWTLGTLAAGASRTISVNAVVQDYMQGGSLMVSHTTARATGLKNNITRAKTARVDNKLRSQLALSTSQEPLTRGDSFTASVDVGNISTQNINNLVIRLQVPRGINISDADGGSIDASLNQISWSRGNLAVLGSEKYEVTLQSTDIPPGTALALSATLSHDGGALIDTAAGRVLTISELPSPISLDISTSATNATAGQKLGYTLLLTNESLIPVSNTSVLVRVPRGLTMDYRSDAQPDANGCFTCNYGSEAKWSFPTIGSGETRKIDINPTVAATLQAGNLINTKVTVTADGMADSISRAHTIAVN